jgi:hypothetical protein
MRQHFKSTTKTYANISSSMQISLNFKLFISNEGLFEYRECILSQTSFLILAPHVSRRKYGLLELKV